MHKSVEAGRANYLGQVGDWHDPVTYSKTAMVAGSGVAALAGLFALTPLLLYTGGAIGVIGAGYGLQKYHPFEKYIGKPETQSIMLDWLKDNPQDKQTVKP